METSPLTKDQIELAFKNALLSLASYTDFAHGEGVPTDWKAKLIVGVIIN